MKEGDVLKALADGAIILSVITEAAYEYYFIKGNYLILYSEQMHHLLEVIPTQTPLILGREEMLNW